MMLAHSMTRKALLAIAILMICVTGVAGVAAMRGRRMNDRSGGNLNMSSRNNVIGRDVAGRMAINRLAAAAERAVEEAAAKRAREAKQQEDDRQREAAAERKVARKREKADR